MAILKAKKEVQLFTRVYTTLLGVPNKVDNKCSYKDY